MDEKLARDISALADGECTSEEQERLLDLLCEDDNLAEEWGKLHHLKSLLKENHDYVRYDDTLAARVLSEIEQLALDDDTIESKVNSPAQNFVGWRGFGFQWRPVWLGGAIATAAVGAVLFVVSTTFFDYAEPPEAPPLVGFTSDKNLTKPENDGLHNALHNHLILSSGGAFNDVSHVVRFFSYNPE